MDISTTGLVLCAILIGITLLLNAIAMLSLREDAGADHFGVDFV